MRKKLITILLVLAAAMAAVTVPVYSESLSTSGAVIMKQAIGARQLGMGGAFTAVADDIATLSYNPAGLGNIGVVEVGAAHVAGLGSMTSEFAGGALPAGDLGTFGVSLVLLNAGTIEINRTDSNGQSLGTEEKNAQQDSLITAGFGMNLGSFISLGAAFKMLTSTLVEEYKATANAIDLGVLYVPIYEDLSELSIGASIMNAGLGKLKYLDTTSDADADNLPLTIRTGVMYLRRFGGYYGDSNSIMISGDVVLPNDSSMRASVGVEGIFEAVGMNIAVRGGLKYNEGPSLIAFACGAGLVVSDSWHIDLGYGPMGDLGSVLRVSFMAKLGSGKQGEEDWW